MRENAERTESVFAEAVALPAAERAAFLERACAGNDALRGHVEALLRAHERHDHVLDRPVPGRPDATQAFVAGEQPNTVVAGRYKLLEQIGEGGMGTVWVAEQTQPVKRKVALKLIKPGMDSKSVVARFEQERQALALMDHPNVAKVFDGGLSETGRPFFAMEYVKGVPITEYCDTVRLSVRERLELFAQVCEAVQHAHQKGIIHRDLKPSNILVAPYDDRPVPKIIDFGLAKAMHQALTDRTLHTAHDTVLGTPLYMSPEQAQLNNIDVDTRSDVYSLGVLLYELLTGTTPLERKRFREAAWDEVRRIIREEEPPRPSARLSSTDTLPSLAACRHTEPLKLATLVRGDLDWIVMKALEKERSRRYETANGFALDVRRYLAGEPVAAAPPTAGYRFKKFLQRHRGQALAVGLTFCALAVGSVGAGWGWIHARQANLALAEKNAELAAEQSKVQARFELAQKAIGAFHTGVSEDVLLKNDRFQELRTKLLKEAADFYGELEKLLQDQTDAKSRQTLAAATYELAELTNKVGDKQSALAVHRKALAIRRELAVADPTDGAARLDVARSLIAVGKSLQATGDTPAALRSYQEACDLTADPTDAVGRAALATAQHNLGGLLSQTRQPAAALRAFRQALAIRQKLVEESPNVAQYKRDLARSHYSIGWMEAETGRSTEALAAYRQALAVQQELVDANAAADVLQNDLAYTLTALGNSHWKLGELQEGLVAYRRALAVQQRLVDANPAVTEYQRDQAASHFNIGLLLRQTGDATGALAAYRAALAVFERLVEANPTVPQFQADLALGNLNLGNLLTQTGRPTEALAAYRRALPIQQKLADANPNVERYASDLAANLMNLGYLQAQMGASAEALATYRQALAIQQKLANANPAAADVRRHMGHTYDNIGALLARMGQPDEALAAHRQGLALRERLAEANPTVPMHQMDWAQSHANLARRFAKSGKFAEAFAALETALAICQKLAAADGKALEYANALAHGYAARGWIKWKAGQKTAPEDLRRAVDLWAKDDAPDLETRFERARASAILAALAADAKSGEAIAFADRAMKALQDAVAFGWAMRDELQEPDFDVLRGRADFQQLFAGAPGRK